MNIRPKIILVVLPLVIAPLVMAAFVSYLSARNGISAVASGFLRFKTQTLVDYMEGQWDLLADNGLETDAEYLEAAEGAIRAFAESLIRSETEIIIALDSEGNVVMGAPDVGIPPGPYKELVLDSGGSASWNGSLSFGEQRRVAYADRFVPWEWTILVTESWDAFYLPVTRIALLISIIGAASLIVSLIFLIIATGLVTKPLESMVNVIEGVMDTMDLTRRVPVYYEDETGRLAHSFNLMAGSLEKANDDIKNFALRAVFAHRRAVLAQKEAEAARDEAEEARQKENALRTLFARYVPQTVIDANIARTGKELTEGLPRAVSILMSDIRDFTSISEGMEPNELVSSLNGYFELCVDVIDRWNGITDKYIGDAIMALFGAVERKDDDTLRSVLAALEMLDSLDVFNREQVARGSKPFKTGIGIHYGSVTAGNIGSEKKMDYTVIGDPVNLASRLEGLTKYYGVPLVISEDVKNRCGDKVATRLLDRAQVKGRKESLEIYTASKQLSEESLAVWNLYTEGQGKYYDRDFPGAQKAFQRALKEYPDDKPSRIFLERTLEYQKNPPPEDWDGVYQHVTK